MRTWWSSQLEKNTLLFGEVKMAPRLDGIEIPECTVLGFVQYTALGGWEVYRQHGGYDALGETRELGTAKQWLEDSIKHTDLQRH